jgi:two-component system sensor kinase FixL
LQIGGERRVSPNHSVHQEDGDPIVPASVQRKSSLRTTEARWRTIVECAVDAIIVIDARGRIDVFNPAAERMFGYSEAEVRGRNVSLLMPPPFREEHDGYLERYLQTGERRIIGVGRQVMAVRRDGSTFPVRLSVGESRDGGHQFVGILHDLTDRVRLEERLREQSSLALLGEMAAVIAHEVRNPLAAVRGAVQVIGSRLPGDGRDSGVIKEIIARLDALNSLLNDLLLFARTPVPRFGPVLLHDVLAATGEFLTRDPLYHGLQVEVDGEERPLIADPELLKIAFQNLFINAAQAMQGAGTIRASVETTDGGQRVTIADLGPGIPPDIREKLFRPFFTTKARGTGLGLSIARRLVELHGGTLAIDSPATGGTVVSVDLPAEPRR